MSLYVFYDFRKRGCGFQLDPLQMYVHTSQTTSMQRTQVYVRVNTDVHTPLNSIVPKSDKNQTFNRSQHSSIARHRRLDPALILVAALEPASTR